MAKKSAQFDVFRKMLQGRFAILSGCRLDLNSAEYGMEGGGFGNLPFL